MMTGKLDLVDKKVTDAALSIMTHTSLLACLSFLIQEVREHHDGLDYLPPACPCTLLCYFSSQDHTIVYLRNYGWYLERSLHYRTNSSLSLSLNRWTVLITPLSASQCRWTSSSITPFAYLRKWTVGWMGLLAGMWTAKWTCRLMITNVLTLTLIFDGHLLPTTLALSELSPF